MVDFKILMSEIGGNWQDVTHAVVSDRGIPIRRGFGSLADATDLGSVTLTLRMESLEDASLLHVNQKQVQIFKDNIMVFEGVSFDDATVDMNMRSDVVYSKLKFKPYSSLFELSTTDKDLIYTDVKVLDDDDAGNSLVHILVNEIVERLPILSDYIKNNIYFQTTIKNEKTLPFVLIEEGENLLEVLVDVLYQNGYSYFVDMFKISIVEPYKERGLDHVVPLSSILAKPKIRQEPYVKESKCVVRVPKIEIYDDEIVYEANSRRDEETGEPTEYAYLEDKEYYPEMVMDVSYATEREDDNIELAYTFDNELDYVAKRLSGENVVPATLVVDALKLGPLSGEFRFYNNAGTEVSLRNITIKAKQAYYRDWSASYKDDSNLEEEEIDGFYILDEEDAKNFIKRYNAEIRAEKTTVQFRTHLDIAPNSLIEIAGIPYHLLVRYRTDENDSSNIITYDAVAYMVKDVVVTGKIKVYPKPPSRDGKTPRSLSLYALGSLDAPFIDHTLIKDDVAYLADDSGRVGIEGTWSVDVPIAGKDEYIWVITGTYVPPEVFPSKFSVPVRMTGEPAKFIELTKTPSTIQRSARGLYKTQEVIISASVQNIVGELIWACTGGTIEEFEVGGVVDPLKIKLIADTVSTGATITATIGDYIASVYVDVVVSGGEVPINFGGVTTVPTTTAEGALIKGDYFLWAGADAPKDDSATPPYDALVKGEIYEFTGTRWSKSSNGDLVMTLFDSFAEIANDVDSQVVGNAVIKKLVSIDAFIKNLQAENIKVGLGDGTVDSGFRFRAYSGEPDDEEDISLFDVTFGDNVVFKIDPFSGEIFFGENFRYDPQDKSIKTPEENIIIDAEGKLYAKDATLINVVTEGIRATAGTFEGLLNTHTLQTGIGTGIDLITVGSYSSDRRQSGLLYAELASTRSYAIGVWHNSDGSAESKTISEIMIEPAYYEYRRYRVWFFGWHNFSTTARVFPIVIKYTNNTTTRIRYVREKTVDNWGDSYPAYPTFSSNPATAINEGIEPNMEGEGTGYFGNLQKMVAISNLKMPDPTKERLYILNLPSDKPSESDRVWRDGEYLKIT